MHLHHVFLCCFFNHYFLYSLLHVFSAWRFVYLFIELCIEHNIHARAKQCTLCKMLHLGGGKEEKCFALLSIFIVFIAFAEFL